jgi:hypothetical protein
VALPAFCPWLIRAASWVVPRGGRGAWRQQREADARQYWAFLCERESDVRAARAKLAEFCRTSFRDAIQERFPVGDSRLQLRRAARGPAFLLALAALLVVILALATGLFSGIRTLYAPLPYADPDRLVSCYQVHFLTLSWGAQSRYVRPWQQQSTTLAGLAAYQVWSYRAMLPGFSEERLDGARVTPEFFEVLGVKPVLGRVFQPQDSAADAPVILSYGIWQRRFGSDPGVIGARISLEGRSATIIGVLPQAFWYRSRRLQLWTLLPDLTRPDPATQLVGTVGRLRPGVTPAAARLELQNIAWRSSRFRGGAFRVVPLAQSLRPALQFILLSFAAGAGLALGLTFLQFLRSWLGRGDAPRQAIRYWAFFFAKAVLLLGAMTMLAVELAARNALSLHTPSKFVLSLLIDWASILATLLILRWAVLDQSRRCPVCLRRLGMPVTSGSWSSALIEPASTELLCDQGHGALRVSDSYTTLGEIQRWIALEDSWRELLTSENKPV